MGQSFPKKEYAPLPRRAARPQIDMDGVCAFLRNAFPVSTALYVHSLTGISASTVDNWLRHISKPGADHLAILFTVFGNCFLEAAYPAMKRERPVRNDRLDAAIAELTAAIEGLAQP